MSEATFTFRVEESLKSAFATAAKAQDRSSAQLLRDFMRDFVRQQKQAADYDDWFRRQVEAGIAAAETGDVVSAADVEAHFERRREATRQGLTPRK